MDQNQRLTSPRNGLYAAQTEARHHVSAARYYFVALFVAAAVFFIVWALLHDDFDDTPIFVAAFASILCALSFVFVREVIVRRSRRRAIAARRLSQHLKQVGSKLNTGQRDGKLTLKRNEQLLNEIRAKSEAAKVLGKFADAHEEVFVLCEDYLKLAANELSTAHPTSPRVPALRKGSISAGKRHRFHMLRWAEIKARSFTAHAGSAGSLNGAVEAGEDALAAVDRAIEVYPDETTLSDSREVLRVYLVSAKVKIFVREAEKAIDHGEADQAVAYYREALAHLEKYDVDFEERGRIYDKIQSEISRIEQSG